MKTLKDKYQNNATKRIKQYEKLLETFGLSTLFWTISMRTF